ncbi:hypothetical protein JOC77_000803 [Peribacillus deserti]|uniref:Lipoprotein n=1 Tax=Peribacillus deserti TaxID=673318 RepID=A0ABS2QE07_9BACI|nr:hypothetical protein [Peribacillus deserti]MBM7691398.1 hypothetical protein [Peribacillus deserti]
MKMKLFSLLLITLSISSGCTNHPVQNTKNQESSYSSIQPYTLTQKEKEFSSLTPIDPGELFVYKLLLTKNETVEVKVDHYAENQLKQTFIHMSSSLNKGESRISIGLDYLPGDQKERLWFATLEGAKGSTVEKLDVEEGAAFASDSLAGEKKLQHDKFVVIGTYIHNSLKTDILTPVLNEPNSLKTILKENENVYVFSCRIKKTKGK